MGWSTLFWYKCAAKRAENRSLENGLQPNLGSYRFGFVQLYAPGTESCPNFRLKNYMLLKICEMGSWGTETISNGCLIEVERRHEMGVLRVPCTRLPFSGEYGEVGGERYTTKCYSLGSPRLGSPVISFQSPTLMAALMSILNLFVFLYDSTPSDSGAGHRGSILWRISLRGDFHPVLLRYKHVIDRLKGDCSLNQNWACFVRYLKIINPVWKYHTYLEASWPRKSRMVLKF